MVKIYYDRDADLSALKGKTIAVVGYGSQGNAQLNCMNDSGLDMILGLRPEGNSWEQANKDGFDVFPIAEAVKRADIICILIPDTIQAEVYEKEMKRYIQKYLLILEEKDE